METQPSQPGKACAVAIGGWPPLIATPLSPWMSNWAGHRAPVSERWEPTWLQFQAPHWQGMDACTPACAIAN
eukprot:2603532-Karenia_brevis.AAC.1